jgi:5-methylcytosine-specific restriction endonuclease McrA
MSTPFHNRVMNIYAGMKRRTEEKRFKSGRNEGRIRKHGIELPFKAADLERWLLARRESPDKPFQCHYCTAWITLMTCAIDHKIPTGKGGTAGFENLDDICEECNSLKSQLLPESFEKLLAFLRELGIHSPACAADIHNRLVKAVGALGSASRLRARLASMTREPSPPPVRAAARMPEADSNF